MRRSPRPPPRAPAEDTPLDLLDGRQGGLDGRPLALGAEVRAEAGASHGPGRRTAPARVGRERDRHRAARVRRRAHASRRPAAGVGSQLGQVCDRGRSPLLGEPDQPDEHLRRRLRVRQRPVTGPDRRSEEERGEPRPNRPTRRASRRRASPTVSTTGAEIRRPRCSTSRSRNARSKRALWATSTASPAKARNRRTRCRPPGHRAGHGRRSRSARRPQAGAARRGRRRSGMCRPGGSPSSRTAPISQIAACAGRSPVVSRSTTTYRAASSGSEAPGGSARATVEAARRGGNHLRRRRRAGSARPSGACRSANRWRAASDAEGTGRAAPRRARRAGRRRRRRTA